MLVHEYGVFFGTRAHPCKVLGRLQGQKLPKSCEAAEQRVFILGQDPRLSPLNDVADVAKGTLSEAERNRRRLLRNPLTSEPFKDGTLYFSPALANPVKDWLRVIAVTVTGCEKDRHRVKDLVGRHFEHLFCHSNGCTEALRLAKKGIISVDHVIHMGSPWGTTTTFVPDTTHAVFYNSGDVVSFASLVRLAHIPRIVWDEASFNRWAKKTGKAGFQDADAPQIFVNRKTGALFPHAVTRYFDGIEDWVQRSKELPKSTASLPQPSLWRTDEFRSQTKSGRRYGLPWLAKSFEEYRGFNIQGGYFDCNEKKRDCFRGFYANYKFAKHTFRGPGAVDATAVKACIDKEVPTFVEGPSRKMIRLVRQCVRSSVGSSTYGPGGNAHDIPIAGIRAEGNVPRRVEG